MKPEYDFSKGERGKFLQADGSYQLPVYLAADVQKHLVAQAEERGIALTDVVNELLRRDIEQATGKR